MAKKTLLKKHYYSRKQSRKQSRKHSYYIVRCYNKKYELNYKYLEEHLKKIDVMPDTNAMNIIKNLDDKMLSTNKIQLSDICDYTIQNKSDIKKFPAFDKKILKADVFFINSLQPFSNTRFYYYSKYFINKIDYSSINKLFNKFDILSVITKNNPELAKYCPPTFKINELDKYQFPKWYILRPLVSFGGIDIFYINNKKDLDAKIKYYNITENYRGNIHGNNVAVSEYISNPLLFKGKKFHFRINMLFSIINNVFNAFLLNYARIVTAKEPFDMIEPFTKEKHDTHLKSTDDDYNFANDFNNENLNKSITKEDKDILWNKITEILIPIAKTMEKNKNQIKYSDTQNCYYVFGIDMMVRDNLEPAFIEINYDPAVAFKKDTTNDKFSKLYFNWINETVLEPLFKYKDPMKARTHPTYLSI